MQDDANSRIAIHNLIFGSLAVQINLLTASRLIDAMNLWMKRKQVQLGQILVEQGWLTSKQRDLLDALVAEYLQVNGGDPEKAMQSIGMSPSLRSDLLQLEDPEITTQLSHRPADEDFTSTVDGVDMGPSAGRYRKLRPHASGGLGDLYVANDSELNREVALKEIKQHLAFDSDSQRRFTLEAEVTGNLEHPGVVPVYGFGRYADGRPFYAMRLIRGRNLKDAIQAFYSANWSKRTELRRTLDFLGLLRRFIDVCNVIGYAHSRGVLHRDLKPSNVMLGKYGETLVVDWGLAKTGSKCQLNNNVDTADSSEVSLRPALSGSSFATCAGARIGTPAYMSPEQAAGKTDELTNATDIYSLGATLYVILTGTVPFNSKTLDEIIKQVLQGEFLAPKQVNSLVPVELNAICCKAMSLVPANRYALATDLALDVERWLAGESVAAYRDPWPKRLYRIARRHKVVVASCAIALLVAVPILLMANIRIFEERRKTVKNYGLAVTQSASLIDFYVDLEPELIDTPKARNQLLKSVQHTTLLLDQDKSSAELRFQIARLSRYIGNLYRLAEEFEKAETSYNASIRFYKELCNTTTGSEHTNANQKLTETIRDKASMQYLWGKPDEAISSLTKSIDDQEVLHLDNRNLPIEKAHCLLTRAAANLLINPASSKEDAQAAIGIWDSLANSTSAELKKLTPEEISVLKAFAWDVVAQSERFSRNREAALKAHDEAIKIVESVPNGYRERFLSKLICLYAIKVSKLETQLEQWEPSDAESLSQSIKELSQNMNYILVQHPQLMSMRERLAQLHLLDLKFKNSVDTSGKEFELIESLLIENGPSPPKGQPAKLRASELCRRLHLELLIWKISTLIAIDGVASEQRVRQLCLQCRNELAEVQKTMPKCMHWAEFPPRLKKLEEKSGIVP